MAILLSCKLSSKEEEASIHRRAFLFVFLFLRQCGEYTIEFRMKLRLRMLEWNLWFSVGSKDSRNIWADFIYLMIINY